MTTVFSPILLALRARLPEVVGAAFVASDGELVDHSADDGVDLPALAAHQGVVLSWTARACTALTLGEPTSLQLAHTHGDVLLHAVTDGYFLVLLLRGRPPAGLALLVAREAAYALAAELG